MRAAIPHLLRLEVSSKLNRAKIAQLTRVPLLCQVREAVLSYLKRHPAKSKAAN